MQTETGTGGEPATGSDQDPGSAEGAIRGHQRRRMAWCAGGLGLLLGLTGWCVFWQAPWPDAHSRPRGLARLACPIERNPHLRLPGLPPVPLTDLHFIDADRGWLVGAAGLIAHTADGGRQWSIQSDVIFLPPALESSVSAPNEPRVSQYSLGNEKADDAAPSKGEQTKAPERGSSPRGSVVGSGPASRRLAPRLRDVVLRSVCALPDGLRGWVAGGVRDGREGVLLRTTNGGALWAECRVAGAAALKKVLFTDASHGWCLGLDGRVIYSVDGGDSWLDLEPDKRIDVWQDLAPAGAEGVWLAGTRRLMRWTGAGSRPVELHRSDLLLLDGLGPETARVLTENGECLEGSGGGNWASLGNLLPAAQRGSYRGANADGEWTRLQFVDSAHGWVSAEDPPMLLSTRNGGRAWEALRLERHQALTTFQFLSAEAGWAISEGGELLRTVDGGRTWLPQARGDGPRFRTQLAFARNGQGWRTGDRAGLGIVWHSRDLGRSWEPQRASEAEDAFQRLAVAPDGSAWAAGSATLATTTHGGSTWERLPGGRAWRALSFHSPVAGRALAGRDLSYSPAVYRTSDAGRSWTLEHEFDAPLFTALKSIDDTHACAVGRAGVVAITRDGGTPWNLSTNASVDLLDVDFISPERGWIVGEEGTLLHTADGGLSWRPQASGTTNRLVEVSFLDAQRGLIVGWNGVVLNTSDGGSSWRPWPAAPAGLDYDAGAWVDADHVVLAARDGALFRTEDAGRTWSELEYRRHPAPVFYAGLALVGLCLWRGTRRPPPVRLRTSLADRYENDRPLEPGDRDVADLDRMAAALANYLRNRRTTGPLTLAISGPWGSGKSSLMNLVRGRLERLGVRPVWFNAWHHEDNSALLASLLESVRRQAVPPWWSPSGLGFRLRLLLQRQPQHRFLLTLLAGFLVVLNYKRPELAGKLWNSFVDLDALGMVEDLLKALESWPDKLVGGGAALALGANLVRSFRAFGADPSKILAAVSGRAQGSGVRAGTGVREQFAAEFRQVAAALQPATLTVFIDDLDRCEPEHMLAVMQAVNFLASSGECFVILGMEEEAVTACLAEALKGRAAALKEFGDPTLEHTDPRRYAVRWMEKFIQVRVAVPALSDEQRSALARGSVPAAAPRMAGGVTTGLWRRHPWLKPLLTAGAAVGIGIGAAFLVLPDADRPPSPGATGSATATVPPGLGPAVMSDGTHAVASSLAALTNWRFEGQWASNGFSLRLLPAAPLPAQTNLVAATPDPERPTSRPTNPETLATDRPFEGSLEVRNPRPTRVAWWGWCGLLVVASVLGMLGLRRRIETEIDDSPEFQAAVADWVPFAARTLPTPRAVKRFVNRLRFHAMSARDPDHPTRPSVISDRDIVAYGALEAFCPELIEQSGPDTSNDAFRKAGIPDALLGEAMRVARDLQGGPRLAALRRLTANVRQ